LPRIIGIARTGMDFGVGGGDVCWRCDRLSMFPLPAGEAYVHQGLRERVCRRPKVEYRRKIPALREPQGGSYRHTALMFTSKRWCPYFEAEVAVTSPTPQPSPAGRGDSHSVPPEERPSTPNTLKITTPLGFRTRPTARTGTPGTDSPPPIRGWRNKSRRPRYLLRP
jgi:hypothetical protein